MNRPYRGLTKDGKWVYGNLIVNNAYDLNDGTHKPEPMHTYIRERDYTWVNDPNNKRWTHISYEVIPKTVGHQIGLPDKNGVEIYEGDDVDVSMSFEGGTLPHRGVIVYDETFGAFGTKNDAGITLLHNHCLHTLKIIGNVHQEVKI